MDQIDQIVTEHLEGLVVRKDLADKFRGRFSVPTYVGEFLIGKYCATSDEDEIQEGLEEVERLLSRRVVRTGEQELFKAQMREQGSVQLIDLIRAKLDAKADEYIAEIPSLQIKDALIGSQLVLDNDRMLTGGFYAQLGMKYVPGQPRPFVITEVRPIQAHAGAGLSRLSEARELMSTREWKEFLLRSVGLEPAALDQPAQDAYLLRMVPFVVRNYNMVELGPRGTGKSHLFQQVSPYAYLLSGGQVTVAQLFVNNANGQRGLVTQHDVIAFDEIAGVRFKDRDGINVMKGYMASGEFARGRESIRAEGGMAFLGNFEVDVATQLRRGHLLGPMPEAMRDDTAFMDRLHGYVPGWDIPAVGKDQKTDHYGLVSDLLAQWWHELRAENRYVAVRHRIHTNESWRGRDTEAVDKTVDGLLKLLYPDPSTPVESEDLAWAMELATVARRRVKEAQAHIGADEFGAVGLGYSIDGGPWETPVCPESDLGDISFPDLVNPSGDSARIVPEGLPTSLPARLPRGYPIVGFGEVEDGPLGEGAFGAVYRIRREFGGDFFAGKLFKRGKDAPFGAEADRMLAQEVKALESLTHDNVVRVVGPVKMTSAGEWIVISEWIDGQTLEDLGYKYEPLSGAQIARLGDQLMSALTYLEAHGAVHRDLKPANVMVDEQGNLKVIDFNLMRDEGDYSEIAGTRAYMPPDTLLMGKEITGSVDRFSVGVMLYELLTRNRPYANPSFITLKEPPTRPRDVRRARSDVPDLAAGFLMRAVAPLDSDRFSSAAEMKAAWDAVHDEVAALPPALP